MPYFDFLVGLRCRIRRQMSRASSHRWRTAFVRVMSTAFAFVLCTLSVEAQPYPSKPVRFIVPYAPGGAADVVARIVADKLSGTWAPVVVEPKPGANGNIGADYTLRQPGDGYTFLVASGFITVAPEFQPALKWSYKTFVPVGLMVVGPPNVFVVPANSPFATLQDFARAAKARPRQINVGTPSLGSSNHLGLELFYSVANIETFAVPYQGAAAVVAPVLRGDVAFTMLSQSMISSFVRDGKMKALAVSSPRRAKTMPDVPTVAEAGFPNAALLPWFGLVAPPGTPRDAVDTVNSQLRKALVYPDVVARMEALGAEIQSGTSEDFYRHMEREAELLTRLIKQRNIRTE